MEKCAGEYPGDVVRGGCQMAKKNDHCFYLLLRVKFCFTFKGRVMHKMLI